MADPPAFGPAQAGAHRVRPRLLDLFCGAGGAAMGYHRAGFDVVGVDIRPQPNYPFEFVEADALDVLGERHVDLVGCDQRSPGLAACGDGVRHLVGGAAIAVGDFDVQMDEDLAGHVAPSFGVVLHSPKPALRVKDFAAIHASPPCQAYSRALRHMAAPQPELLEPVRTLLEQTRLPWVIENVIGAPIPNASTLDGRYGLELCGTQFGLRVGWHRLFESSLPLDAPRRPCSCASQHVMNPHNQSGRDRIYAEFGEGDPEAVWRHERGTAWMGRYEAREAIPPAYTELIGHQLLQHIRVTA